MSIYKLSKSKIVISEESSSIFFIPSGSRTDKNTAISASIPQIVAITCSSNFENRLTKLTTLNAYAVITLVSGSIGQNAGNITSSKTLSDKKLVLRYIDSSSFSARGGGRDRKNITDASQEHKEPLDSSLIFSSSSLMICLSWDLVSFISSLVALFVI